MAKDTAAWLLCHTSAIHVSKSHTEVKRMAKDTGLAEGLALLLHEDFGLLAAHVQINDQQYDHVGPC